MTREDIGRVGNCLVELVGGTGGPSLWVGAGTGRGMGVEGDKLEGKDGPEDDAHGVFRAGCFRPPVIARLGKAEFAGLAVVGAGDRTELILADAMGGCGGVAAVAACSTRSHTLLEEGLLVDDARVAVAAFLMFSTRPLAMPA